MAEALDHGRRAEAGPEILAGPGTVTAIAGLTFAISDETGDIGPGPLGLIARDTRHLSCLQVMVDGEPLNSLGAGLLTPDVARFRSYALTERAYPDAPVECERERRVWAGGLEESVEVRCWAPDELTLRLTVIAGADFADIFEVRRLGSADAPTPSVSAEAADGGLRFTSPDGHSATTIAFRPPPDRIDEGRCQWTLQLERGQRWRLAAAVKVARAGEAAADGAAESAPGAIAPPAVDVLSRPDLLGRACRRSAADYERLTMSDTLDPERRLLAAGIPWFVALFGRDNLIASYQARAFDPARMLDGLRGLAARQGRRHDPGNEEEPGKILHEVRLTDRPWLGEGTTGGARPYYGSIDATPLFLIVYGTAWRWGAPRRDLEELLPAARAALEWMRGPGDPDRDGLLEYRHPRRRGLGNQGWKDSENAIQFPDGSLAEGPIALVEVQGYAYRARRELAAVLSWLGEGDEAGALVAEADALRAQVRERFWRPGRDGAPGSFVLALDGDKRPVPAIASNMAHLLWCGVPSNEEAEAVARHLTGPALNSGWGVRTLSREMAGFNPISYHVGSVWPHDTAIACEGLRRYGLDEAALAIAADLLDALEIFDLRLPELYGGHSRERGDFPVPYPTACRPQAWAAGVPLTLVPTLLGLEPCVPEGIVSLSPALPRGLESLEIRGVPFPTGALSVAVDARGAHVYEAPAGLSVELRPRAT